MEPSDPEGDSIVQDDGTRRAEALRELARGKVAGSAGTDDTAPMLLAPLHASRVSGVLRLRFWLGVALMVALLTVVVASILSHVSPPPVVHQARSPAVSIAPATELISCPTNLSWSPDARMIAVVGYANGCLNDESMIVSMPDVATDVYEGYSGFFGVSSRVAIYDAHNGGRLDVFSPDDAIYQALDDQSLITPAYRAWLGSVNLTPEQYLGIKYTNLVWSTDGSHIYLAFTSYIPDGPPVTQNGKQTLTGRVAQGLFIARLNGQHGQVLLHVSDSQSAGAVVWDLTAKREVAALPVSLPFTLQPFSERYTWQRGGALQPATANTAVKGVGAPQERASTFAIWQPGVVATQLNTNRPGVAAKVVNTFSVSFAALSPDGRYLAAPLGVAALLTPPPDAQTLAQVGWQSAPHLPVRDVGLQKALEMADQNGLPSASSEQIGAKASVAWRPDGRVLAVSVNSADHALVLLDCASGKQVASLTPIASDANNTQGHDSLIAWAPDGRSLAYFNPAVGTIAVWDSSWLPA